MYSHLALRLARATEHLETLRAEIKATEPANPLRLRSDKDTETGRKLVRLDVAQEPPPRLGLLAGEIAYQIRSTLNNLIATLVVAQHQRVTRDHAFPILWQEQDWTDGRIAKELGGLSEDQLAVVREYQPFLSDDPAKHPLCAVARLANLDKHQAIPPVFVLVGKAHIQVFAQDSTVSIADFEWVTSEFATPLHDGAILCSFLTTPDPDAPVQVKWDAQLPIGFGDPVAATITDLANTVELVRTISGRFERLTP